MELQFPKVMAIQVGLLVRLSALEGIFIDGCTATKPSWQPNDQEKAAGFQSKGHGCALSLAQDVLHYAGECDNQKYMLDSIESSSNRRITLDRKALRSDDIYELKVSSSLRNLSQF